MLQRANNKGEEFVFLDGPPYANGNLHMGELGLSSLSLFWPPN